MLLAYPFSDSTNAQLDVLQLQSHRRGHHHGHLHQGDEVNATGVTGPGPDILTPISITSIACTAAVTGAPTCSVNIGGGVLGDHNNLLGQITVSASSQTLAATGSTCATLPNDTSVTFTGPSRR